MNRNETRARHKPFGGLPSTKENNHTAQGRGSGRIKLLLPEYLKEFPEPIGIRARWDRGRVPIVSVCRRMKSKSRRQCYTITQGNRSGLRP